MSIFIVDDRCSIHTEGNRSIDDNIFCESGWDVLYAPVCTILSLSLIFDHFTMQCDFFFEDYRVKEFIPPSILVRYSTLID